MKIYTFYYDDDKEPPFMFFPTLMYWFDETAPSIEIKWFWFTFGVMWQEEL